MPSKYKAQALVRRSLHSCPPKRHAHRRAGQSHIVTLGLILVMACLALACGALLVSHGPLRRTMAVMSTLEGITWPKPIEAALAPPTCDAWTQLGHAEICGAGVTKAGSTQSAEAFEVEHGSYTIEILQQADPGIELSNAQSTVAFLHGLVLSPTFLNAMSHEEFEAYLLFAEATALSASDASSITIVSAGTYTGIVYLYAIPTSRHCAEAVLWSSVGAHIDSLLVRSPDSGHCMDRDAILSFLSAYRFTQ